MKKPARKTDLLIAAFIGALCVFLSFRAFPLFEALERIVYSIETRLDFPRPAGVNRIAIVNIDEKSLQELGPWPWSRHLIADMINILKTNGAKLIGLDLMFSHKEQNQGLKEVTELNLNIYEREKTFDDGETHAWVLESLKKIEKRLDNDRKLSETVREAGNVILPVAGKFGQFDTELIIPLDYFLEGSSLRYTHVAKDLDKHISVEQLTTPFPELSKSSRGLGHINLSPREGTMGHAHLPFINYRGHIIPSMSLRLALDYLDKYPEQVAVLGKGIKLGQKIIPTTEGAIFIKFRGGRRSFPHYSFVDILGVKKFPAVFEDKIVLIGITAGQGGVYINTPVDPKMPRVELTANNIDGFLRARYLERPETMIYIEAVLIVLLGFFSSFFLSGLKIFSRTALTGALLFAVFLSSTLLFMTLDIWFKITYICLSLVTLYVVYSVKHSMVRDKSLVLTSKEGIGMNRMLGLSSQSQGMLDLAFENFRKCPLDDAMKEIIYNLGLDFEQKRMINKAISAYEYITKKVGSFRDLDTRIPKLKKLGSELPPLGHKGKRAEEISLSPEPEAKPFIGRYEILGELGRGPMGIVYKARDPEMNRFAAIKTTRLSEGFEDNQILSVKARFLREAKLASKLSHPSIISIYDVGEDYDLTYMAMELLEGNNLEDFCRKDALLSLRKTSHIIAETADALDYAHSQGVIHGGVKPANIMLLKGGHIKVTDFGIAKAISSAQVKSEIMLVTPDYMSPEQIRGKQIDGRSDIFSLGVVFFQLLTGQLPFSGSTLSLLSYQITQERHPSPREINPRVIRPCEQIIDKALKKDPSQRFQRAGDFAKYLRIICEKLDGLKAKKQTGKESCQAPHNGW